MSNATHNALLTTTAGVLTVYSLGLLLIPALVFEAIGLEANAEGVWTARLLGCTLLAFAGLAFFARHLDSIEARRAIDGAFLMGSTAMLAISMWAQYLRVLNALGWINVAVDAGFAVAFFYFLAGEDRFMQRSAGRPA